MKKQTAVEWLIDEIRNHIKEHGRLDAITISELKMKAKEMEKEQIIEANNIGYSACKRHSDETAEKYYTSKYE
jgi:hypothetical protein